MSGFVSAVRNATLVINDCIYKGKIISANNGKVEALNAFVSVMESEPKCTLNNAAGWAKTFAPNPTLNNCYYLNLCGKEQGMKVTEEQLCGL